MFYYHIIPTNTRGLFFYKQFAQSYGLSPRIPNNPVTIYPQTFCHVDNFIWICHLTTTISLQTRRGVSSFLPFLLDIPGDSPLYTPPRLSYGGIPPPLYGFFGVKTPYNPLNKVFTKKFWKNFYIKLTPLF